MEQATLGQRRPSMDAPSTSSRHSTDSLCESPTPVPRQAAPVSSITSYSSVASTATTASATAVLPTPNSYVVDGYTCYSYSCRKELDRTKWKANHRCYSPSCFKAHNRSYWRHPKLRKLLCRASITCALRIKQSLSPFASFVPRNLHDYLIQLDTTTTEEIPFGTCKTGAVIFADTSGFTALTERLAKRPNGAEELCQILNSFFSILVGIVQKYGGDIIKFAGDAVSIVWAIGDEVGSPRDIAEATLWATRCAFDIHKRLHNYIAITEKGSDPVMLSLHIGVGCGRFTCIHVGGVFGRWEYVVAGPPMGQIAVAEPLAEPGETVISPEAWEHVRHYAVGTPMSELAHKCPGADVCTVKHRSKIPTPEQYNYVRADQLNVEVFQVPPPPPPIQKLSHKHIALLRRYIPAAVLPRLKAGHGGHLAELRDVSVLFVKCDGLDISADEDGSCAKAIEAGQHLMLEVQRTVYSLEGSINKFLVDDKGLLVLCVFGLPPMAHSDDARRAVDAAQLLIENFPKLGEGIHGSVGVASGTAFCGVVGSLDRREYTVMGDMVNLAARLMAAAGPDQVYVDEATMQQTENYMEYSELPTLKLKGKKNKIRSFAPIGLKETTSKKRDEPRECLDCREEELKEVQQVIANLRGACTFVLTGERGMGKSSLVDGILEMGKTMRMLVLKGQNKTKTKPQFGRKGGQSDKEDLLSLDGPTFASWQGVLKGLVTQMSKDDNITPEEWIYSALSPLDHKHVPLLKLVLNDLQVECPPKDSPSDNVRPRLMTSDVSEKSIWDLSAGERTQRLKKIMLELILYASKRRSILVLLHLQTGTSVQATVDAESWSLAHRVWRQTKNWSNDRKNFAFFVVSRPVVNFAPVEFIDLVEDARTNNMLMQLKPLASKARYDYLVRLLGVSERFPLPQNFVDFVSDIAAGNPKHIEELVEQLISCDAIMIENGRVRVIIDDFSRVTIPESIIGTVRAQIDRMQPRHQLFVKVASVCNFFSFNMLRDFFPYAEEVHHLPTVLSELVESGILKAIEAPNIPMEVLKWEPDATVCYCFHSKLLQHQANKLLLDSNRKDIENIKNKIYLVNTMRNIMKIQTKTRKWLDWAGSSVSRRDTLFSVRSERLSMNNSISPRNSVGTPSPVPDSHSSSGRLSLPSNGRASPLPSSPATAYTHSPMSPTAMRTFSLPMTDAAPVRHAHQLAHAQAQAHAHDQDHHGHIHHAQQPAPLQQSHLQHEQQPVLQQPAQQQQQQHSPPAEVATTAPVLPSPAPSPYHDATPTASAAATPDASLSNAGAGDFANGTPAQSAERSSSLKRSPRPMASPAGGSVVARRLQSLKARTPTSGSGAPAE